jgi:type II secretory pathway component PulF
MGKVSFEEITLFTKHLSVLIKSGITLVEGLEILINQIENKNFKKILTKINNEVKEGHSFYSSLKKYSDVFPLIYLTMIKVGEQSGKLDVMLDYLASYLKKQYDFKKKIESSLLYPKIILATAFLVGMILSLFVLPRLVDVFKSLEVKLPLSTQILITFAFFIKNNVFLIVLFFILGFFSLKIFLKQKKVRQFLEVFSLRLPVFGNFFNQIAVASFCRNLGIMIKSGVTVVTALDIIASSEVNYLYQNYAQKLKEGLKEGKTIFETIQEKKMIFFPKIALRMIEVGEKSGRLDETLLYLADFFEEETDVFAKDFATLIEPLVLLVVGLVVAFLAISILSPIYEISSGFK